MKAYFTPFILMLILILGAGITACQKINPKDKTPQGSLLVRTATIQIFDENSTEQEDKLCGYRVAFLLRDGTYILPTNLSTFLKEPSHNQIVNITYRSEDSKAGDCTEAKSVYLSHVDIPSLSGLD
ncbi:hypothetical protein Fleli_0383 [Bernardetia litoralis DSM 6794]|uniref:Lipoprotein n=1 Tax=Bernardetia litoralis (strain ATCC 23117 / DSM 6794 / NBRC 15988 / NCIMB 1366 / Fx l1 / Sio-4) TaxID=880071 RepID=I4AFX8_BERLS|nr:hypothetical protein [Bernardetia litoralis]AFM02863.1 hypothetical protein Fleli_0383 [Bernardetia litoralis DSM 6794]